MTFTFNPVALLTSSLTLGAVVFLVRETSPIWDCLVHRRIGKALEEVTALGASEDTVKVYMKAWGLLLLIIGFIGLWILKSVPLTIVLCFLAYQLPTIVVEYWLRTRKKLLRDQLVLASIGLANSARAGLSLNESIEIVARETPRPLKGHFDDITNRYACGISLNRAIGLVAEKLKLESFSLMAAALRTTNECGGNLAEAMERISESLHEHQRLDRKMDTNTASARRSSLIMAAFPIFFLGIMFLMVREGTVLMFTSLLGQIILAIVIVMMYFGKRWIDRIMIVRV